MPRHRNLEIQCRSSQRIYVEATLREARQAAHGTFALPLSVSRMIASASIRAVEEL